MNKNLYLVIWVSALLAQASLADVFSFRLSGYPKKDRNCHAQKESISAEFEKGTGLKALHVECVKEKQTSYDFLIEYEAPKKLQWVSTDYTSNLTQASGRYRLQSECIQALPSQSQIFEAATELKPVFSYCRSLELDSNKNWEIILIAEGKPVLSPYIGGYLIFARPHQQNIESLRKQIQRALEAEGALLADMVFHQDSILGTASMSVHYFAPKLIDFHMERLSQVTTLDQCLSQARDMENILSKFEPAVFAIYCGERHLGYHDLHVGFIGNAPFSWQNSVDSFGTWSECEQNRFEVLKNYEGSSLGKLLGGVCSRNLDNNRYQVVVLKSRSS
jgi:hypothetical protein